MPPSRFDSANAVVGSAVAAVLVALLGFGVMAAITAATPRETGANIGGAILATGGSLVGVALAALHTARRARRRGGQPIAEGTVAGTAGFAVAAVLGVMAFAVYLAATRGPSQLIVLAEVFSLLTLVPLVGAAAVGGAALGTLQRRHHTK